MQQDAKQQKQFLALTALEEFWDTTQPMTFLHHWCKPCYRKNTAQTDSIPIFEHKNLPGDNLEQASHFTEAQYELLLPKIAAWLNKVHGTHYSLRYWRMVAGPFLFLYIQVFYDRYMTLQSAYALNKNWQTIGMDASCYLTPIGTRDFFHVLCSSDSAWNQQLLTQLLNEMQLPIARYKKYAWQSELKHRRDLYRVTPCRKLTNIKIFLLHQFIKLRGKSAVLVCKTGGNFDHQSNRLKILRLSKACVIPVVTYQSKKFAVDTTFKPDFQLRDQLCTLAFDSEFQRLILATLKYNMPLNFIEQYQAECKQAAHEYPFKARTIWGGWLPNDRLAIWGAKLAEQGTKLVAAQHGGGYGMLRFVACETIEKGCSDAFISWGWRHAVDEDKNVVPAASPLICKRMEEYRLSSPKKRHLILFAATLVFNYKRGIDSTPYLYDDYLATQQCFLDQLNKAVFEQLVMRLKPASPGELYLRRRWPTLKFVSSECGSKESFYDQLQETKILVCDNPNSTFLYALAFNIPTLLFWDKAAWPLRDEAKIDLAALERVGIYYDSPTAAANALSQFADDPQTWWQNKALQDVRAKICDKYARYSDNWLHEWVEMLQRI